MMITVFSQDYSYPIGGGLHALKLGYTAFFDKARSESTEQVNFHVHAQYELHGVLKGECEIALSDDITFIVEEGCFVMIPSGRWHRIIKESDQFSKFVLTFDLSRKEATGTTFYAMLEKELQRVRVYPANDSMTFLAKEMVRLNSEKQSDYKTLLELYTCSYIVEAAHIVMNNKSVQFQSGYYDERVDQATEFIGQQVAVDIDTQDVADHVLLSKRQLLRLFKRCLGCTIEEYIRREKIKRAKELLYETEMPVAEIAECLGFSSAPAFNNFYKRYEGNTPSVCRREKYSVRMNTRQPEKENS